MDYTEELIFAKNMAQQAYKIAQQYYKTNMQVDTKSDDSPVTIADKTINQMVITGVQDQFPEHGVLGEEQSWHSERAITWVCDPLDGTIAFTMAEPNFMFSLALVVDGVPVVAVTCDLAGGDVFWATKDGGAFRNGERINVSTRRLAEARLVFQTNLGVLYKHQQLYESLAKSAAMANLIHGGVFKGMLIAQGFIDGTVWPESVDPWDLAAVRLIVEEAGGKFTNPNNEDHQMDRKLLGGVIVSNGVIHDDLLGIVAVN